MNVVALDPFVTAAKAAELGFEVAASLDELLPRVDFLTVHVPLTDETKSLIGARELALMKKTARVLNVARGGIVDEQALAEALAAGTIAGAGVDVFSAEPIAADNPLLKAPNVVLTPHLGASTVEAQENVAVEAAQLIADFLLKGQVANAVNMAAVDPAELAEVRLYVDLARRLGLLHAQMAHGAIRKATLTYRGELAGKKTRLLTAAFTAGLLEYRLSAGRQPRQRRGAGPRARHRDRRVVQPEEGRLRHAPPRRGRDRAGHDHRGRHAVRQPVRAARAARAVPPGSLPRRRPARLHAPRRAGLIGFIGTIFGKHEVNIAQMTVGRQTPGGEAIGVLNLDSPPPEAGGERGEGSPADQQRDGGQTAAGRRIARLAGVICVPRNLQLACFLGSIRAVSLIDPTRTPTDGRTPCICVLAIALVAFGWLPPAPRGLARRLAAPPHLLGQAMSVNSLPNRLASAGR